MTHLYNVNPREQEHEDRTMELGEARSPLWTRRSWSCSSGHRESLPHPRHHCIILRSDLCPPHPRSRGPRKGHVLWALTSHFDRPLILLSTQQALTVSCTRNHLLLLPGSGIQAPPLHALPSPLWVVICRVRSHSKAESAAGSIFLSRVTNAQLMDQRDPALYTLQLVGFVGKVYVSWDLLF